MARFGNIFIASILILAGIFGIFGFFSAGHATGHICPVSLTTGAGCPPLNDVFALASHHLFGFYQISRTLINFGQNLEFFAVLLVILIASAFKVFNPAIFAGAPPFLNRKLFQESALISILNLRRFLAICLRKVPDLSFFRAHDSASETLLT